MGLTVLGEGSSRKADSISQAGKGLCAGNGDFGRACVDGSVVTAEGLRGAIVDREPGICSAFSSSFPLLSACGGEETKQKQQGGGGNTGKRGGGVQAEPYTWLKVWLGFSDLSLLPEVWRGLAGRTECTPSLWAVCQGFGRCHARKGPSELGLTWTEFSRGHFTSSS